MGELDLQREGEWEKILEIVTIIKGVSRGKGRGKDRKDLGKMGAPAQGKFRDFPISQRESSGLTHPSGEAPPTSVHLSDPTRTGMETETSRGARNDFMRRM